MSPANTDADDTLRSPDQLIRRAKVVYGRRSNNHPPPATVLPIDEHQQPSGDGLTRQPPTVPSQSSVHAPDNVSPPILDEADCFQFGFRHRLKELDEEFDGRDTQSSFPGQLPFREAMRAGPSQVEDLQSVSMGTAILSSEARHPSVSLPPASLLPSPASLHAISTTQEYPLHSPPRTRNVLEAEESSSSSFVSPIRHVITTPHSRSSPTPPTSGEIPMASRKTKGKAPARDMLPLLFDDEQPLAAELPIKSKRGRRSEPLVCPKTKAPTKKERRETALESSRIAAGRPVEVERTQEQKHSLSAFFTGLRRNNVIPTSGAELASDPIEKFSSPIDNSACQNSMFGAPTERLRTPGHVGTTNQSSCQGSKVLPPPAGDSDDEMASVAFIVRQENGKLQKLQAMKQLALQRADTSKIFDINSDDDDLLIVKDDMHTVARAEAAQRRLDKAHGSPVKDIAVLRRINHPSVRPAVVSPSKLSKREWQELAKPSFARKKGSKGQLTKKQLDQLMIMQYTEEQLKSIKRHEEEWVKGGGRLLRDAGGDGPQMSLSQKLGAYAEMGLKAVETETGGVGEDEASVDESEDHAPNLRGPESPEPMDADADGDDGPDDNMEISHSQVDEEEEELLAPLRRNKSGQRHSRVVVGSDDEGEQFVRGNFFSVQRDSASSMESQTEDENDKENSAKLMYDRSEDKENKAVVRHQQTSSDSKLGVVHGIKDNVRRSVSLASVTCFNESTSSSKEDARSPLKDISKDEDDLFLSSPSAHSSFKEDLLRSVAISPSRPSASTSSLGSPPILRSERISRTNCLSLISNENDTSGFKPIPPSFLERLHSQVSPEPSLAFIKPLANDGFSQLFSAEDQSSTKPISKTNNDRLSLTLDVRLKPALEVSGTLRQKAEGIFEKEQEYLVAAAAEQTDRPKEALYVNDHGFLTQTRPDSSPQVYHMTPSQASKFSGTQVHSTQMQPHSTRPPLRTLSFTITQELSPEPQPLRRLRRRSPSPLEQKFLGQSSNIAPNLNVYSVLGIAPKPPDNAQKKPGKSEFVAVEAEESDEDDMFGFGGPKKDDDEEEDDNEQDRTVEGLVDDTAMDAETEAADLVLEKHREHEEEDDQRLQKLHQDATEGKFRMKRRDRGIGFEDDSDEDEDDDECRIRRRMHKKRKIEGDSLEALGQSEETRAFYNTYHQDLVDEDDEFGDLREDAAMPADDTPDAEPDKRETVSVDEVRQRVREIAQSNLEVEVLDPEDTSWIDQSMIEADNVVPVKVIRNTFTARHPNAGPADFISDVEQPTRHAENEQERKQMTSWANKQNYRYQGTGRAGNSTAITSHTKVKTGSGSLRSMQPSSAATISEARKTRKSGLLSTVSNRRNKFT